MNHTDDLLLHGATIVTGEGSRKGSVAVSGERISGVWYPDENGCVDFGGRHIPYQTFPEEFRRAHEGAEVSFLEGKILMAGGIDAHVHFREPGMTAKADMETESLAALFGGVTSFIDMPNTNPPTVSAERLEEKIRMADGRSSANFGFHIGATNSNFQEIEKMLHAPGEEHPGAEDFAGIKVFMGSSTGNMLVDSESVLSDIFREKGKEVLVHCEDEKTIRENLLKAGEEYGDRVPFRMHSFIRSRKACIKSSAKALEMAIQYGTRLHLLHISTAEEVEMVRAAKRLNSGITAETSVNYLWFCDSDYDTLGAGIKCNPSIKTADDRAALRTALKDGTIDTIGTDHAPHLPEEKARPYMTAPSGIPSIQQSLPVLMTIAGEEGIPLSRIASVFSEKAASMFGIKDRGAVKSGSYADLVIIDPEKEFTVRKEDLKYKCGWTPYEGAVLKGAVETVYVNGVKTVDNGVRCPGRPAGKKLIFKN